MQIRTIHGQRATDRDGAAERSAYSRATIDRLARDRDATGFPQPVDADVEGRGIRPRRGSADATGREWYALSDLDRFFRTYRAAIDTAALPHSAGRTLTGDPDELLNGKQSAAELGIAPDTFYAYIRDSEADWRAGRPGYLPRPDEPRDLAATGRRYWTRRTLQHAFVDHRPGRSASPGRPPGGGATLADLQAAMDELGPEHTVAQLMTVLSARLGRSVSRNTVSRLRSRLRDAAPPR